ncbi:hypothetical protein F4677DRAFT_415118 [Hypoxylon crocopeplum]|nr:hypothetical protein F4677DRAFT_415118 [Hypoxylon crocopeplum]
MATDWSRLRVMDLRVELRRLGLPQNGLKADLVARLKAADSENVDSQTSNDNEATEGTQDVNGDLQPEQDTHGASEAAEATKATPADDPPKKPEAEVVPEAQDISAPTVLETQSSATPLQPSEVLQDSQKRKRRSLSPAPSAHEIARKRARQDDLNGRDDYDANFIPEKVNETKPRNDVAEDSAQAPPEVEMEGAQDEALFEHEGKRDDGLGQELRANEHPREQHYVKVERDVEPSIHPATKALYIRNFMRPLRPQAVKEHLVGLATPVGVPIDEECIVDFYLDNIRSHAFVVFNTISSASRVRSALHNSVWPDETNRKALWVDFIPPERFAEWVDMEQSPDVQRGASNRYEVVYSHDDDGNLVAKLTEYDNAAPAPKPAPLAPESLPERKPSIPTGPSRQFPGIEGAPTGPRNQQSRGPLMHPGGAGRLDQPRLSTRALPIITYQPVSDDLVTRRLDAISAAKTHDLDRDFGKEYKRYYFEDGTRLVDRGPEIFLGIRPPHRERERRREQRREPRHGRRGPGGGRPRRGMPIFHGVPRGGDRFRPGNSASNDRSRYHDDRDRSGRGDSYNPQSDDRGSRRDYSRH